MNLYTGKQFTTLLDASFDEGATQIMERLVERYMLPYDQDLQEYQSKLMDRWEDRRVAR